MGCLLSVQTFAFCSDCHSILNATKVMPMQKKLYPFPMRLRPQSGISSRSSLSQAPPEPTGIDDIILLATGSAGRMVNHVAVLYALLGLVL